MSPDIVASCGLPLPGRQPTLRSLLPCASCAWRNASFSAQAARSIATSISTVGLPQIVHSLRTRGDMNFEEINLVIPCIEAAHDYGYTDLDAPQVAPPRMFKTHFWYRDTPKGAGKYIYVTRGKRAWLAGSRADMCCLVGWQGMHWCWWGWTSACLVSAS